MRSDLRSPWQRSSWWSEQPPPADFQRNKARSYPSSSWRRRGRRTGTTRSRAERLAENDTTLKVARATRQAILPGARRAPTPADEPTAIPSRYLAFSVAVW